MAAAKAEQRQRLPLHWPTVRHLFATELRIFLRDRRSVFLSLVLPVLLMPIFIFAASWNERQREQRIEAQTFGYALTGSEAERARTLIAEGAAALQQAAAEPAAPDAAPEAAPDAAPDATRPPLGSRIGKDAPPLVLEEKTVADARAALDKQEIHFLIETYSAAEVAEQKIEIEPAEKPEKDGEARKPAPPPAPLPLLRVVFAADWDYSQTAAGAIERQIDAALERRRAAALAGAGFAVERERILPIAEERDLASAGQRSGLLLGKFGMLYVLLTLVTGGAAIAADTIAGEKERGSLETLLTSAASRVDIVTAKMLLILAVGVAMVLMQVFAFLIYAGFEIVPLPESFAFDFSAATILWLILLLAPLAAIVSGMLLLVSAYSRSYKDFQQKFFPVSLLAILPAAVAALPGIELRSAIVLVPLANLSVAVREVLVGKIDWLMLGVAWLVSAGVAAFLLRSALGALSAERLVTAAEVDEADYSGGEALFPRHVLRIFAVMWVVLFLVSGNVQYIAESIERQLIFNFGVVFLGGSLFSIWRYRLDYREAFNLRPVAPAVWLAVLIGAPSFLLTGVTVAKLSEQFLPMPRGMLEAFGKALVPPDMGMIQMLLMLAVLPGIVEELTFRGVLLHGLKKKYHPVVVALVVGVIFGLFHFALFRLVPTAFLGAALTAVTLLTGSVLPAMLWHALNNSLGLLAGMNGLDILGLDPWVYPTAVLLAALSFYILWRNRTPLPGLRRRRPDG